MKTNAELSPQEFEISFQLKLAMRALFAGHIESAQDNINAALRTLHGVM